MTNPSAATTALAALGDELDQPGAPALDAFAAYADAATENQGRATP